MTQIHVIGLNQGSLPMSFLMYATEGYISHTRIAFILGSSLDSISDYKVSMISSTRYRNFLMWRCPYVLKM